MQSKQQVKAAGAAAPLPPKQRGRPFVPGQSGNPAGRKAGSKNKMTVLCENLLGGDAEAIMKTLIAQALAGEGVALRLAVERMLPVRAARDRSISGLELPRLAKAEDIVLAMASVLEHVAAGNMTLSEAGEFARLLEGQRKNIETSDLVIRLEAIERSQGEADRFADAGPVDVDVAARVRRLVVRQER